MRTFFRQQLDAWAILSQRSTRATGVGLDVPGCLQARVASSAVASDARNSFAFFSSCVVTTAHMDDGSHTFVRLSPCFCAHWPRCGPNDATKANKSSCGATDVRCQLEHAVSDGSAGNDDGNGGSTPTCASVQQIERRDFKQRRQQAFARSVCEHSAVTRRAIGLTNSTQNKGGSSRSVHARSEQPVTGSGRDNCSLNYAIGRSRKGRSGAMIGVKVGVESVETLLT